MVPFAVNIAFNLDELFTLKSRLLWDIFILLSLNLISDDLLIIVLCLILLRGFIKLFFKLISFSDFFLLKISVVLRTFLLCKSFFTISFSLLSVFLRIFKFAVCFLLVINLLLGVTSFKILLVFVKFIS